MRDSEQAAHRRARRRQGSTERRPENADVAINVWCLHIHSKALELFGENWKLELTSYVELAQNKNTIAFFSRRALWSMFVQSIKGRNFLRFIYG